MSKNAATRRPNGSGTTYSTVPRISLVPPCLNRAAKVEAFEQRDFLAAPAGLVAGLTPQRQDVAEPDRLEIGLEEARLVELGIAPEAGEVEGEGGLRPFGRGRDHIPAVAGQGDAD